MKRLALTTLVTAVVAFAHVTAVDARPSGEVWLYAENIREGVRVNIYKSDGSFDEAALAKLDALFRCVRTGVVRAVRPELYEKLSMIYDHFGGKRIDLISGFRFRDRSSSRHFHASAMDIRVRGASLRAIHRFAMTLDDDPAHGMGIGLYPRSKFIHIDFRAPGAPSYRWTDGRTKRTKKPTTQPARTMPARRPTS